MHIPQQLYPIAKSALHSQDSLRDPLLAELVALVGHAVLCHEQRQLVAAPETLQCKLEMIGLHCPAEIIWRGLRVVYAVAIDTIAKVIINGNVITLPHHLAQEIIILAELHHPGRYRPNSWPPPP